MLPILSRSPLAPERGGSQDEKKKYHGIRQNKLDPQPTTPGTHTCSVPQRSGPIIQTSPIRRRQALVNPFRTAVPVWGQTTQTSSSLSPKRDCGSVGVKIKVGTLCIPRQIKGFVCLYWAGRYSMLLTCCANCLEIDEKEQLNYFRATCWLRAGRLVPRWGNPWVSI